LSNLGYFNAEINNESEVKNNKLHLTYNVYPGRPYIINSIKHRTKDSLIANTLEFIKTESLIKSGDIYNAYTLDDERERITAFLKDFGYFNFSKEYIYYEVDSSLSSHMMNVVMVVKNPQNRSSQSQDSLTEENHKQYSIGNVYINPDYDLQNTDKVQKDTTKIAHTNTYYSDTSHAYYFLHNNEMRIKTSPVIRSVLIRPDKFFALSDVQKTYRRLSKMRVFKYSNIHFEENPTSPDNILDAHIDLARSKVQSYTIEAEGTNSSGKPGLGANLVYENKNIFRGAEIFQVRLTGALEGQKFNNELEGEEGSGLKFLNTLETGGELRLSIPKFIVPFRKENYSKTFQPTTTILTGLNYMQRPIYRRYISNASFGYNWAPNPTSNHLFFPIDLSSIKIFPTDEFQAKLDTINIARLKNQYTNHLIMALKYSFIFNNQDLKKLKNFVYLRANFESSGNVLKLYNTIINTDKGSDDYFKLFGIRYAQYIRTDLDFRHYNVISKEHRFVFRTVFGIGIPYGNSIALPFEKGFFAGGANGMRGWELRRLGPGSYSGTEDFERIGDLQLEANVEYRFPIYSFFKGALFVDAGNVWLLNESTVFPSGEFKFNRFINEIAVDAGIGFRFDFDFFIFRIDVALPIHDPAQPEGDRWVINKSGFRDLGWNFGIGYPF